MLDENGKEVGKVTTNGEDGKTGTDGNFEITDFIPGKYTIVYTWGDKTYTSVNNQEINVQDYKATIYQEPSRQNALDWYRNNMETRYQDAFDDYTIRKQIDDLSIENPTITTMDSTTPTMEFGVELKDDILSKITLTPDVDKVEFTIPNIDFGIVERARQQIDVQKRATALKITLGSGQILVDARIEEENGTYKLVGDSLGGVTYMGPSNTTNPKNGFIRSEIDNELIQDAKVEIEYEIIVKNNSEKDYDSAEYYHYGNKQGEVIKIRPVGVYDYLDKEMTLNENNTSSESWEVKTTSQYNDTVSKPTMLEKYIKETYFSNTDSEGITTTITGYESFEEYYQEAIADWKMETIKTARQKRLADKTILYNSNLEKELEPGQENKASLHTSKILANSEEIDFDNDIEVTNTTRDEETGRKVVVQTSTLYDRGENVTITGPTGDNNNYLPYIVLGISTLIILGAGIVLIIKKVL